MPPGRGKPGHQLRPSEATCRRQCCVAAFVASLGWDHIRARRPGRRQTAQQVTGNFWTRPEFQY